MRRSERAFLRRDRVRPSARQVLMGLGVALLLSALGWRLSVGRQWTQRIRPGWEWAVTCIGTMTYADPKTGHLPEQDTPALYERRIRALAQDEQPRSVVLEERLVVWEAATGEKTVKSVYRAAVDERTGTNLTAEGAGNAFVFPRRVTPTAYTFQTGYLNSVTLTFQRKEDVEGLETYVFNYQGPAEYSQAYAGTDESRGVELGPSQQIKCRDDQFSIDVWVEPVTGEVVKLREGCPSGDYIYDTSTDLPVAPVARWGGTTASDDTAARVLEIRSQRRQCLWASLYMPGLLLLAGLAMMGSSVVADRLSKRLEFAGSA